MSWTINAPLWLIARPIAHRGLHDGAQRTVENSLAAARRAIDKNYAIECDVQMSEDGDALVFHDKTLMRLIGLTGNISALNAHDATRLIYRKAFDGAQDCIATLSELLATVAGRVPLIVEVKSRFDGDARLAARVASLAADYAGPLAVQSFDPQVLCMLRELPVTVPIGLVAEAAYSAADWPRVDDSGRQALAALTGFAQARPDFLSWRVNDLPHAVPLLCRTGIGLPVLAWTVRNEGERALAFRWTDQIIFEGFEA
jgi:glycerophosphoryl diester phosphodiesterase